MWTSSANGLNEIIRGGSVDNNDVRAMLSTVRVRVSRSTHPLERKSSARYVPSINSNSRVRTTPSILPPLKFELQLCSIRIHARNSVTPESVCGLEQNEVRLDSVAAEATVAVELQAVS